MRYVVFRHGCVQHGDVNSAQRLRESPCFVHGIQGEHLPLIWKLGTDGFSTGCCPCQSPQGPFVVGMDWKVTTGLKRGKSLPWFCMLVCMFVFKQYQSNLFPPSSLGVSKNLLPNTVTLWCVPSIELWCPRSDEPLTLPPGLWGCSFRFANFLWCFWWTLLVEVWHWRTWRIPKRKCGTLIRSKSFGEEIHISRLLKSPVLPVRGKQFSPGDQVLVPIGDIPNGHWSEWLSSAKVWNVAWSQRRPGSYEFPLETAEAMRTSQAWSDMWSLYKLYDP